MAKDPAFLFYPGDAAEDVSHMNRLERGAYFDIVQSQKKFGPLSITLIKKILGKDFDSVWDALKICLTYEKDMYFIAWLQDSIEKRKKYSASRANNRKGQNQSNFPENAKTYVEHMENGNENRIVIDIEKIKDENEKQNPIEIGTPNGHRVVIQSKYVGDVPIVIHGAEGLKKHFTNTGQLDAIERAKWIDFDGFMEKNPARFFDDADYLYNSFKKHHEKKPNDFRHSKSRASATITPERDYSEPI
jgi:hypothetical protein